MSLSWIENTKADRECPNIIALLEQNIVISNWIVTLLLNSDSGRARGKQYEYFVSLAMELKELNNYHVLFSILTAFATVESDLDKKTMENVERKYQKFIDNCFLLLLRDRYNDELSQITLTSTSSIPYTGFFLEDISKVESTEKDKVDEEGRFINFDKLWSFQKVIEEFRKYQRSKPYNLIFIYQIKQMIDHIAFKVTKEILTVDEIIKRKGLKKLDKIKE